MKRLADTSYEKLEKPCFGGLLGHAGFIHGF